MSMTRFENDVHIAGALTAPGLVIPAGKVSNTQVAAAAGIERTKVVHQFPLRYHQEPGGAVVAATVDLHIARAAGALVALEAAITGAIATGADRTVTIDLLKSTGAGAFASVLSAALVLDNTNVLRTLEAATITTTAYVDGDIFRLTVAVAGAAGAQGQGLVVTLTTSENPE